MGGIPMADQGMRMTIKRPRASMALVMLCISSMFSGCGDGGGSETNANPDRPEGSAVDTTTTDRPTTSTTRATTTTTAPEGIAEDVLPYVTCETSADNPLGFDATISVLSTATWEPEVLLSGITGVCNGNGGLTAAKLTNSRRFLVTPWDPMFSEPSFNVVDIASGEQITVSQADLDSWATARTGSGLEAAEETLTIAGFNANGDGTLYLYEGPEQGMYRGSTPLTFLAQDVAELMATGVADPQQLPDERWCYESTSWSPDGATCIADTGSSGGTVFVPASAAPTRTDPPTLSEPSPSDAQLGYFGGAVESAQWLDATTVISGSSKTLARTVVGQDDYVTLYEITGDRNLEAWANRSSGRVYFASVTLNKNGTEIYEVTEGVAEPVLVASIPGKLSPLSN